MSRHTGIELTKFEDTDENPVDTKKLIDDTLKKKNYADEKYVDDLVESTNIFVIDRKYDRPPYTTDMATNGPFDAKANIVPADPDGLKRNNDVSLTLKYNGLTSVLPAQEKELYVFAGFNEISGHISSAQLNLIHPAFGIDFVGVFATKTDTDYEDYILGQKAETINRGVHTLRPNNFEFDKVKFIGIQFIGAWGNNNSIYIKFELILNMKVGVE